MTPANEPVRRILSVDGGGIKGVFPASFLAHIEGLVDGTVADYFDLIVGTSTGGIIALGLGLGLSAGQILDFYEDKAGTIFTGKKWGLIRPRYDSDGLRRALEGVFHNRKLGESSKRLVVPSMNLQNGDVYIYKTAHHRRFANDYKVSAVDVGLHTSAAPGYFPVQRAASGLPLVDGGMWANNPVGLAVVEAIGVLGWLPDQLRVLSLGCTASPFDIGGGAIEHFGLWHWAFKIIDLFMAGQSSASLGTAYVLAGHDHVRRVSPVVPKGRFSLDGVSGIASLKGLGQSEARNEWPFLETMFFGCKAEAFQPYYTI